MDARERDETMLATFGWNGNWYVVVYRGDEKVAQSPEFYLRMEAERWVLNAYPAAKWDN